jgi:Xaa-Pro dipeptidase
MNTVPEDQIIRRVEKFQSYLLSCQLQAALNEATRAGLRDFFMGHGEGQVKFIGHGVGPEIHELPVIAPFFDQRLEPGMVIALEPKFVFPGKCVVGMEDDSAVTSSGVERLTVSAQELIRL